MSISKDKNKSLIIVLSMTDYIRPMVENYQDSFQFYFDSEALEINHATVQAIVTTTKTPITYKTIQAFPNLELIVTMSTGLDHIDQQAARDKKIIIANTPNMVTEDTADIGMALLLSLARKIVYFDRFTRDRKWLDKHTPLGTSLQNKNLGILGLGKIGMSVAKKAQAFGMNIYYCTRTPKNIDYHYVANIKELAKVSDFLVIACPATPETHNIIDLEILQLLGENGFLINIARGSIVNEPDLIVALQNNIIAGAGLDVYPNEPLVSEALIKLQNTILLPHIGVATQETRQRMIKHVFDNLLAYFMHGKALTSVL